MIITIASGKGGTGKTTFAVNLAYVLAERERAISAEHRRGVRLLDCDVEEPNDHLFVSPDFTAQIPVRVPKPVWNAAACTACGRCAEACQYNAIAVVKNKVLIFGDLCHACGVCTHVCPAGALTEESTPIGIVRTAPGSAPFFFADGLLNIGESLAPAVVEHVKHYLDPQAINIIDAAPGTACPVVKAVEGADVCLLMTEPTPFGLNDLKLAVGLSLKMRIPTGIIVNRSDGKDTLIADYAHSIGVPIAGRIPFSRAYAEAYSDGKILVDEFPELKLNLLDIFDRMATAAPPEPAEDTFETASEKPKPFTIGTASDYKEITIISGKGGTGKTTLTASLACLADHTVMADNDVDAADLYLLLKPSVLETHDFVGGFAATINPDACIGCGRCASACHFHAIREERTGRRMTYQVEPLLCESCGLCALVCPVGAVHRNDTVNGQWYVSATSYGPMVHARLGIAQENSGKLVSQVRQRADLLAHELKQEMILGDGPPGTGCPVIASVTGTDLVVVVTEPTVSGVHDMTRVMQLAAHFGVPVAVVINKADLNVRQAHRIHEIAESHGARIIGSIPFDPGVNDALVAGKTVIEYGNGTAADAIRSIWKEITGILKPSVRR
ncbi:P-loop NTPase [bacterium]|nr:P-loop NTPase [candidate division CSSED10-310 bacterium]